MESLEEEQSHLAYILHDKLWGAYRKKIGDEAFREWRDSFIAEIKKAFPDSQERRQRMLYHILLGGSPPQCSHFDFEGECSIQKRIESLEV